MTTATRQPSRRYASDAWCDFCAYNAHLWHPRSRRRRPAVLPATRVVTYRSYHDQTGRVLTLPLCDAHAELHHRWYIVDADTPLLPGAETKPVSALPAAESNR